MKVSTSYHLFEAGELSREILAEALSRFSELLIRSKVKVSAVYPADFYSLPFALFISRRLAVPVKNELSLKKGDKPFMLFSFLPFESNTHSFFRARVNLFRRLFPEAPSVLVASPFEEKEVDVQILKAPLEFKFPRALLEAAQEAFYWPIPGTLFKPSPALWKLSQEESRLLNRAKRIRDAAQKYLGISPTSPLTLSLKEPELLIWEKFAEGKVVSPDSECGEEEIKIEVENPIEVADKKLRSAVSSLLERLAQRIEEVFPTSVAYTSYEAVEREGGVLIIPKVKEENEKVKLRLEFILKSLQRRDFEKLLSKVKAAVNSISTELKLKGSAPIFDWTRGKNERSSFIYLSWSLERKELLSLLKKTDKRWLMERLFLRKSVKEELLELYRLLEEFSFNLENVVALKEKFSSLWRKGYKLIYKEREKIGKLLDKKGLWPLILYFCVEEESLPCQLCNLLSRVKGFCSPHHFFAEQKVYWTAVKTKRHLRALWESVERGGEEVVVIPEPLNPERENCYIVQSSGGEFLGYLPPKVSLYLSAKERAGATLRSRKLYVDSSIFTENSYWVEIECL